MTIDNKVTDEKLQHDINREKYQQYHQVKLISMNILQVKKYLNADQNRIIEQANIDYSPIGKAFEKQIKHKRENKIKPIEQHGKQGVKFNKPIDESYDKILKLSKEINYDDLTYHFKCKNWFNSFNDFDNAFSLMKKIKNSEITLAKNLNEYKPDLSEMKRGRNKSKEQKNTLYNTKTLYKA